MNVRKRSNIKKSLKDPQVEFEKIKVTPDGRIDAKQAAKLLGFHIAYLYNCRDESDMPPYTKFGRRIYYYYDDIIEWIKTYKNK